jgi:hypothetical protein
MYFVPEGQHFQFVPEGRAIVVRRFIAGFRDHMGCVPEGRLNSERGWVEFFTSNLSATPNW